MMLDFPRHKSTLLRRHRDTNSLVLWTCLVVVNASTAPMPVEEYVKQSRAAALADEEDFLRCNIIICTPSGQNELNMWGDFINSWYVG